VLDLTVRFAQAHAGPIARLAGIVLLPTWILASAVGLLSGGAWAVALALFLAAPALQLPFLLLGSKLLFAPTASVREALLEVPAQRRALALGLGRIGIVASASAISFGLFWLPVQALLLFVQETSALERMPPVRALRRSASLAADQLGRVLGGVVTSSVLAVWCVFAGEALGQMIVAFVLQAGTPFGRALDGDVTPYALGGILLAQPAIALYRLLLYLDVRTVTEGWDLQVAMIAATEEG
jgi:hypothetical protein